MILLITPSNDDAFLIRHLLASNALGDDLQIIESGWDALGYVRGGAILPAVVVLDLRMPLVSGLEVLATLRSQPRWEEVPVIALFDEIDVAMARQAARFRCVTAVAKTVGNRFGIELVAEIKRLGAGDRVAGFVESTSALR